MVSYRKALDSIASQFEAWTKTTLGGAPASFPDLVKETANHEGDLKALLQGKPLELSIFLAAALGGFHAIDTHLRANSKDAAQSVAFKRVDIWGRLKAFEVLSAELAEGCFQKSLSETEFARVSNALLRETKELIDLMMSELALRSELSRIAIFLEWIAGKAARLGEPHEAAISRLAVS